MTSRTGELLKARKTLRKKERANRKRESNPKTTSGGPGSRDYDGNSGRIKKRAGLEDSSRVGTKGRGGSTPDGKGGKHDHSSKKKQRRQTKSEQAKYRTIFVQTLDELRPTAEHSNAREGAKGVRKGPRGGAGNKRRNKADAVWNFDPAEETRFASRKVGVGMSAK